MRLGHLFRVDLESFTQVLCEILPVNFLFLIHHQGAGKDVLVNCGILVSKIQIIW